MQASSEHSVCFAVPEKEVAAVSARLHDRFHEALAAGRLSKVIIIFYSNYFKCSNQQTWLKWLCLTKPVIVHNLQLGKLMNHRFAYQ
jgi:hypothetical protein